MKKIMLMVLLSTIFALGFILVACDCKSIWLMVSTKILALLMFYVSGKLFVFLERKGFLTLDD